MVEQILHDMQYGDVRYDSHHRCLGGGSDRIKVKTKAGQRKSAALTAQVTV